MCTPLQIDIEGHQLSAVEHFTYLGCVISNDATTAKDVNNRIAKASSSFGRLQKRRVAEPLPVPGDQRVRRIWVWSTKVDMVCLSPVGYGV